MGPQKDVLWIRLSLSDHFFIILRKRQRSTIGVLVRVPQALSSRVRYSAAKLSVCACYVDLISTMRGINLPMVVKGPFLITPGSSVKLISNGALRTARLISRLS